MLIFQGVTSVSWTIPPFLPFKLLPLFFVFLGTGCCNKSLVFQSARCHLKKLAARGTRWQIPKYQCPQYDCGPGYRLKSTKKEKQKKTRRFRGKLANWCLVGLMFGFVGRGLPIYKLCPILTRKRWNHSNWAPSNMSKKRYHYHVAILWVKCLPQIHMDLEAQ